MSFRWILPAVICAAGMVACAEETPADTQTDTVPDDGEPQRYLLLPAQSELEPGQSPDIMQVDMPAEVQLALEGFKSTGDCPPGLVLANVPLRSLLLLSFTPDRKWNSPSVSFAFHAPEEMRHFPESPPWPAGEPIRLALRLPVDGAARLFRIEITDPSAERVCVMERSIPDRDLQLPEEDE